MPPLAMRSIFLICLAIPCLLRAQPDWPRAITASDGSVIRVYHPQPDSIAGNLLQFRAAFSYTKKGRTESQFGSFTSLNVVEIDRNTRTLNLLYSNVLLLSLSDTLDPEQMYQLKETIECGLPGIGADISIDQLIAFISAPESAAQTKNEYIEPLPATPAANKAPRIIYAQKPTMLLLMDGPPKFKLNNDWNLRVVVNSPYTIVESSDGWFYLYGGRQWYISPMPAGPYQHTTYTPAELSLMRYDIDAINARGIGHTDTLREGNAGIREIIVSFAPAELIQTRGTPIFQPIPGTSLKYVTNTNNDIFVDTAIRKYFILLSGRWYQSTSLNGQWKYTPSDSLPAGFANIPEGSPADRVLACIAGTSAAREALIDASIPQTARISRFARAHVDFDGPPKFEPIKGTHLQYALNSSVPVFYAQKTFYCIDKAVWFTSTSPDGPWKPATTRPAEINDIPFDCPVHHCKYLYIYGESPEYITMGYTTGYLGACIEDNTVVYGTGYNFTSWSSNVTHPHPWTWGFNMWLNPWLGWTLGYDFSPDWFNTSAAWGEGYWSNGWWGPETWRPPYIWHHFSGHGLYEKDISRIAPGNYNNNIYLLRPDVFTSPTPDEIFVDRHRNIFRREPSGSWSQRTGSSWTAIDTTYKVLLASLHSLEQCHERGDRRTRNFTYYALTEK